MVEVAHMSSDMESGRYAMRHIFSAIAGNVNTSQVPLSVFKLNHVQMALSQIKAFVIGENHQSEVVIQLI